MPPVLPGSCSFDFEVHPMFRRPNFLGLLALALVTTVRAADDDTLKAALSREIIGTGQALGETQLFTESRVPPMPEVNSAQEWTKVAERLRSETLHRVILRGQAAAWSAAKTRV